MKFKNSLILSYFILSISILSLTYISLNIIFHHNFRDYIINKQLDQNEKIIKNIEDTYLKNDYLPMEEIEHIGVSALDSGIIMKIEDAAGNIIWNAIDHNSGLCKEMLEKRSLEMAKYHNDEESTYTEKEYIISTNNKIIASVTLGYYGPYYYNTADIEYLNSVNMIIIVVSIFAFIISIIIGFVFSKKISISLEKIINATKDLFNSDYEKRVYDNSSILEFRELVKQFNSLAQKLGDEKKLRERLSSDIAHELRTPLSIINGYIEALIDGVYEVNDKTLNNLNDEVKRLVVLIEKLERADNYDKLTFKKISLKKLICKHIENNAKEIDQKKLNVILNGNDVYAYLDEEKMNSLVLNLISNAIKYSDLNNDIIINLSSKKNNVEFSISNYGVEIPLVDKDKIFERFYRVDNSRTRETGGQGIGLSIAKAIVLAHGGTITVEASGKQTTFVIILPKKQ